LLRVFFGEKRAEKYPREVEGQKKWSTQSASADFLQLINRPHRHQKKEEGLPTFLLFPAPVLV
jgi:hypothetical protein